MNDRRTRRSLTFIIVAALLVGGGLALAGLATRGGGDAAVVDVEAAVASATPSTVAPRTGPTTTQPVLESTRPDAVSPLAGRVGPRSSAVPEPVVPRARPIGLQIDSIDVARYPVRAVGLEPDGQLEIPDETEIGWYRYGATPGEPGATVLAAHVSWNRTSGPFARLGTVEPGARIEVTLDDGSTRRYEVVERAVYGKLELPKERMWRTTGDEELILITCGGDYNPQIRRYRENIVVYAVPVA